MKVCLSLIGCCAPEATTAPTGCDFSHFVSKPTMASTKLLLVTMCLVLLILFEVVRKSRRTAPPMSREETAEAFERLWNYVYDIKYECSNMEMAGGRRDGDGAYPVCHDVWKSDSKCLVYSFGVGRDFSFDDVMGRKGCEVHSFDPSIELKDGLVRESGVKYHKVGIASRDIESNEYGWKLMTLASVHRYLNHVGDCIEYLKVDTDDPLTGGFEDQVMREILDTGMHERIQHFSMEVHLPGPLMHPDHGRRCKVLYNLFTRLEGVGYKLFITTDNVRGAQHRRKTTSFTQLTKKHDIMDKKTRIYWEMSFINTKFKPCR
uniref:methyltransferase-like protein 24 isoform X2 n=1 Tax=Ciona intestinalis TaxID=7719 RepID=UPI000EF48EE4|nr:methyltransferase-like protein 24 isoform X2 [Ciona intestinalis]|eukprot:XP_026694244.1 methyltransferase-like protein 24 isoform X2 [Ciona intestinalis]